VSVSDHEVDSATPGTRTNGHDGHDPILTVEEFLRLPDQLVKGAAVFLGKSHHLFATSASPGVSPNVVVGEREFWSGVAKQRIPVAAVERLVDGPHDLHVLLQHRLPPQPGGAGSAQPDLVADPPRQPALQSVDYEPGTGRLSKTDWRLQVLGPHRSARISEPARAARDRQDSRSRMDIAAGKWGGERGGPGQLVTIGCHRGEGAVAYDLSATDHADGVNMDAVFAEMGDVPGEVDRNPERRGQRADDGSRGRALHGPVGASGLPQRGCRGEHGESQNDSNRDESPVLRRGASLSQPVAGIGP